MSNRLDQEREVELQPKRIAFAKEKLTAAGMSITFESDTELKFTYNGETITFFPYSGWHSGKSIKPGRGILNLLKQLNQTKTE